jgi:hypothetical protein
MLWLGLTLVGISLLLYPCFVAGGRADEQEGIK